MITRKSRCCLCGGAITEKWMPGWETQPHDCVTSESRLADFERAGSAIEDQLRDLPGYKPSPKPSKSFIDDRGNSQP